MFICLEADHKCERQTDRQNCRDKHAICMESCCNNGR